MQPEDDEDNRLSLVSPVGYNTSTCGYCTPSGSGQRSQVKSSKSYGIWANNITPESYQQLLDRGWRRSGSYIYRPDCGYSGTCCPQIAIRIPVESFRPRSDQKRAISELKSLIRQPLQDSSSPIPILPVTHKGKGKYSQRWDLERQWKDIEWSEEEYYKWTLDDAQKSERDTLKISKQILRPIQQERCLLASVERGERRLESLSSLTLPPLIGPKRRRFETILRVADSTDEKYKIFRAYQIKVHGESEEKVSSRKGFERFLCQSPLMPFTPGSTSDGNLKAGCAVDIKSDSPIAYDLYHMEYVYEGRLIAVGVLDILPRSISSVYLFYDPEYAYMHLGKVSSIREMALVKQIQRKKGMQGVQYYNLGLYIHSCPKMKYKAEYHPAEVLDPLTCEWLSHSQVREKLDRGVRYDFSRFNAEQTVPLTSVDANMQVDDGDDEGGDEEEDQSLPLPPPPGVMDPTQLPSEMLSHCLVFDHGRVNVLPRTVAGKDPKGLQKVKECLAALGSMYNRFCLYL